MRHVLWCVRSRHLRVFCCLEPRTVPSRSKQLLKHHVCHRTTFQRSHATKVVAFVQSEAFHLVRFVAYVLLRRSS